MDPQPTKTEIVGFHPQNGRYFVTISGFFPPAQSLWERFARAFYGFFGHVPINWALERTVVARIAAHYNVQQARASDDESARLLEIDSADLRAELAQAS